MALSGGWSSWPGAVIGGWSTLPAQTQTLWHSLCGVWPMQTGPPWQGHCVLRFCVVQCALYAQYAATAEAPVWATFLSCTPPTLTSAALPIRLMACRRT